MATGGAWTKEETLKLVELWGDSEIQLQLEGCKRNQAVFQKIASLLSEAGYERTYQQCRENIKKLRAEYRKVKDSRRKTGEDRKEWEFFDVLDDIIGTKPSTQPPVVIDTLASTANVDVTPDVSPESPVATEAETGDKSTPTSATPTESSKSRKRKRSKVDDVMDGVARQLLQSVEKSDQRMIELEEKRMKLEERQMERELQAKREERDFQTHANDDEFFALYATTCTHGVTEH